MDIVNSFNEVREYRLQHTYLTTNEFKVGLGYTGIRDKFIVGDKEGHFIIQRIPMINNFSILRVSKAMVFRGDLESGYCVVTRRIYSKEDSDGLMREMIFKTISYVEGLGDGSELLITELKVCKIK